MAQPYIGEIRMFGGNFPPLGWAFCDGQLMPIAENEPLFNLIGTTYGGDGQSTFALPDLRGRIPIHQANNHPLAEAGGREAVALSIAEMPAHSHGLPYSSNDASNAYTSANVLGTGNCVKLYSDQPADVTMADAAIGLAGGSQPHNNMAPYLCVNFIISLFGIFPSPS